MASQVQTRRAAAAAMSLNPSKKENLDQENRVIPGKHAIAQSTKLPIATATVGAAKRPRTALGSLSVHQTANTKVVKTTTQKSAKKAVTIDASKAAKAISEHQVILSSEADHEVESTAKPSKTTTTRTRASTASSRVKKVSISASALPEVKEAVEEEQQREATPESTNEKENVDPEVKTVESVAAAAPSVQEEKPKWDDLDAEDALDPLMMSEYVTEIFEYMKELEIETMASPTYMDFQKDLKWKMRHILVDWMIEIHSKFRLLPETLYLAVNIVDRFLSLRIVLLNKLQLVGVVAMFIAAKYEEICAPSVKNFVYISDNGYTEDEILQAERYVLKILQFNLQYPSPMSFLRRCSKADQYDIQTRTLAKYFMEISLVDHRFLGIAPSRVSAAGLYFARDMLQRGEWNSNLEHFSGYKEEELKETVQLMQDYLEQPNECKALFKKYSSKKFLKASVFVRDILDKRSKSSSSSSDLSNVSMDTPE